MKRIFLLLLVPFFMATQCEDDENSGFETSYIIENNSSSKLFFLENGELFKSLEIQSNITIGSELNSETSPIEPSASLIFNEIKLYKEEDDNFILVYEQNPISNNLWIFNEPVENRFEYTQTITDDLLN